MTRAKAPTRTILSLSALAVGGLITGGLLYAGPLDPPAGPVAPTYKTLTQVEPRTAVNATNTPGDADSLFKIINPGSYYLTGNITGVVGKHGVEIAASGVTLDLNGFDLVGVAAMGAFDGVSVTAAGLTNIAVIDGSVRNWGDEGVDLWSISAANCRVEGLLVSGNAGNGISAGPGSTVTNCAANTNGSAANTYGIFGGIACTIANCTAYLNTGRGIFTSNGGTISHCSAYQNSDIGILTSAGSTVLNCSSYQNGGDGFSINSSSTATNCTATSNAGDGISGAAGCTIVDCSSRQNTLDGINFTSDCMIRGNACSGNGFGAGDGAGIHVTIGNNRIEENHCTGADRGIDVDAAGNIIIKNTCADNTTDWAFVANNIFGPIVDRRVPGTGIISGFGPFASSLASTDPNANFSY